VHGSGAGSPGPIPRPQGPGGHAVAAPSRGARIRAVLTAAVAVLTTSRDRVPGRTSGGRVGAVDLTPPVQGSGQCVGGAVGGDSLGSARAGSQVLESQPGVSPATAAVGGRTASTSNTSGIVVAPRLPPSAKPSTAPSPSTSSSQPPRSVELEVGRVTHTVHLATGGGHPTSELPAVVANPLHPHRHKVTVPAEGVGLTPTAGPAVSITADAFASPPPSRNARLFQVSTVHVVRQMEVLQAPQGPGARSPVPVPTATPSATQSLSTAPCSSSSQGSGAVTVDNPFLHSGGGLRMLSPGPSRLKEGAVPSPGSVPQPQPIGEGASCGSVSPGAASDGARACDVHRQDRRRAHGRQRERDGEREREQDRNAAQASSPSSLRVGLGTVGAVVRTAAPGGWASTGSVAADTTASLRLTTDRAADRGTERAYAVSLPPVHVRSRVSAGTEARPGVGLGSCTGSGTLLTCAVLLLWCVLT
jgi:hypothetical protein